MCKQFVLDSNNLPRRVEFNGELSNSSLVELIGSRPRPLTVLVDRYVAPQAGDLPPELPPAGPAALQPPATPHCHTLYHTDLCCGGFAAEWGVSREVWRVSGFCLLVCCHTTL